MSPDWSASPTEVPYSTLANPQSLNLYAYVGNDPIVGEDADGHFTVPFGDGTNDGDNNDAGQRATEDGQNQSSTPASKLSDFISGLENAAASDALGGAGRVDQTSESGQLGAAVGDFGAALLGAGEVAFGTAGEAVGTALDATGVGALAGVPVNVVSAGVMVEGGSTAAEGFTHLAKDASSLNGSGKAPIGDDGHPMELHHEAQHPDGPLKEMTRTEHRLGENFKKNHQNTGKSASKIDRAKFKREREQYWRNKGNQ